MYDIEMIEMLNLIHLENHNIFEMLRTGLFSKEGREEVTFDFYEKEYKRIMKKLERYSSCPDCSYKNRFEKMKNIVREDVKDDVKHGEWQPLNNCSNEGVYCSICHKKVYRTDYANQKIKSKYCPNCGAKMDK